MFLAANSSSGGLGFLVFVIFLIAAGLIFVAMRGSLRRMRSHVDRGDFAAPKDQGTTGPGAPSDQPPGT
jgi:hypothetical protein